MKLITILLGVCLLALCTAPVQALFAGDDVVDIIWCPLDGGSPHDMWENILMNDIPNSPPVIPVLVEDAMYGHVSLSPDGWVKYYPESVIFNPAQAHDTFRYRTFDGIEYSNDATVDIFLTPYLVVVHGESLKFSTPKDMMLSAQILDDNDWDYPFWMEAWYGGPSHGTLLDWDTSSPYEWYQTPYFHYMPDPGFEGVDRIGYFISVDSGSCGLMFGMPGTIEITVGNPNPVPEFPSAVLPAVFVIGFLGAVLLIRRTRES